MFHIATYADNHFDAVDALWREAFPEEKPWNRAAVAVPEKLRLQPDLLLVALEQDEVIDLIMAGYDGHRGWISRIAVRKSNRLSGVGRALITEAEQRLAALGCTKINLQVVASNASVTDFYKRAGYDIEECVSMSKLLPKS